MLPAALACQDTSTLKKMLTEMLQLYDDHNSDAGDTIMLAYERGTFTKVSSKGSPCPDNRETMITKVNDWRFWLDKMVACKQ